QVPQGPQSDNAHCRSRAAAVQWGNQQPLFPISPRSLLLGETRLSSRIEQLAKPKDFAAFHKALYRDLHLYSCGTPDPIWPVPPAALSASCPPRVLELSRPRQRHRRGSGEQKSPSKGVDRQLSPISDRILELSQPRPTPQPPEGRTSQRGIGTSSSCSGPSMERLARLATAPPRRQRRLPNCQDDVAAESEWQRCRRAASLSASSQQQHHQFFSVRMERLSLPKPLPVGFEFQAADPGSQVPQSALLWVASERLEQLAEPRARPSMHSLNSRPDAFVVSKAAVRGSIPADERDQKQRRRKKKEEQQEIQTEVEPHEVSEVRNEQIISDE
uniref:TESP1 protein n=1 Tax=Macrostomum lignano TaxID=282301 RepID=A0A1I8J8L0_9PLAT